MKTIQFRITNELLKSVLLIFRTLDSNNGVVSNPKSLSLRVSNRTTEELAANKDPSYTSRVYLNSASSPSSDLVVDRPHINKIEIKYPATVNSAVAAASSSQDSFCDGNNQQQEQQSTANRSQSTRVRVFNANISATNQSVSNK